MDIKSGNGDNGLVVVAAPGVPEYTEPVTWLGGRRLLVASSDAESASDPAGLASAVEHPDPDDERGQLSKLEEYGKLLFDAAFGQQHWEEILTAAVNAGAAYLEVAIRGSADGDHVALQALRWEALYDHYRFVTAQGTIPRAGNHTVPIEVGVIRLITPSANVAQDGVPGDTAFEKIRHIPRVLFAVGSHLTDPRVRPGAEVMGIMRRLDRKGGIVRPRVLDRATRSALVAELAEFKPDVLHLIGHGEWHPGGPGNRPQVMVQLRGEPRGEDWVSAEGLLRIFAEAGHRPLMVVLSACQTAWAGDRVSALPFAARLVAGSSVAPGVPVVLAMAGDVTDTTCRVFTQAMTTAIGEGVPLWKAIIRGRRAAFYGGQALDSGHWVMPTLFLADRVQETCLVDTTRAESARARIQKLGMAFEHPVFCGRAALLARFDQLLDGRDPLNVLVAYTPDADKNFGGKRLLRELGARAIRSDMLPVLLGPFGNDQPQDLVGLTREIRNRLAEMRAQVPGFRQAEWASRAVAAATAGAGSFEVAQAIRQDLDALVADLAEDDHVRQRAPGQPRAVLLCHRVDQWEALDGLISLLDTPGLKGGRVPVPVVLTGADVRQLNYARTRTWAGPPSWISCLPLDRLSVHDDEDILAYLWWLLNPKKDEPVYALARTAHPRWSRLLRKYLRDTGAEVFPGDPLYDWAKEADDIFFVSGDDEKLLRSYEQILR